MKITSEPRQITVALDEVEAGVLMALLGRLGGTGFVRDVTNSLYFGLDKLGVANPRFENLFERLEQPLWAKRVTLEDVADLMSKAVEKS